MTMYDIEQDALDAAIKVPYELSPQEMVDKLIDLMVMVPVEPTISGIAMTSKPNLSYDGKYTVVLLMDEPLDSLTMHNRVILIGEPA